MDIAELPNKIISTVEKNATILAAAGSMLGRFAEGSPVDPIGDLVNFFTMQSSWNVMTELNHTLNDPNGLIGNLKWKLWQSPHVPTQLFKVGLALYAAGEIGLIPSKYGNIGKKVATGAGIAAILIPASPPESQAAFGSLTTQQNFARAPMIQNMRYY